MPTSRLTATRASLLAALLCVAAPARSQESSSSAPQRLDTATHLGGPSEALRDALAAACSETADEFTKYLTVRSAESFARLTPVARVAFMKRFVLLSQPGKPAISSNPSGRPIVTCDTPATTTEMQIGGADLRDNLAFLPLQLRDATDNSEARQVTMGMVRENGSWKLLSLGLLMLDLPSLEVEWDSAETPTNESSAIDGARKIADAIESYRKTFARLPETLASLGPPTKGGASADAAGLLDAELASGKKDGYLFRFVIVGASSAGAPAKYELSVTPLTYGRTGVRSFFIDSSGALHGADRQGGVGSSADPKIS